MRTAEHCWRHETQFHGVPKVAISPIAKKFVEGAIILEHSFFDKAPGTPVAER